MNKSIYIIYLYSEASHDRWSYLHRFFHPGILEQDKKNALVGFSLGTSYNTFLSVRVRDFSTGKNKKIHIRPAIVDAMIEIPEQRNQVGFLQPSEYHGKQES